MRIAHCSTSIETCMNPAHADEMYDDRVCVQIIEKTLGEIRANPSHSPMSCR